MLIELNIKETIKKYGLTINEVAERMSITRQTLGTHINGNPSFDVLVRIADAIGCPISELYNENGNKKDNDTINITCPHCGKSINLKIDKP